MSNIKGDMTKYAGQSLGMEQPPPEPKSSSNAKKGMGATGSVSKGGSAGKASESLGMEQPPPKPKSSSVG